MKLRSLNLQAMPGSSAKKDNSGFSLMEVVIALAILSIGIAALIELGSITLRTTKKSEDYSTALIYARSYLEEAYATNTITAGTETFEPAKGFKVVRTIEEKTIEEEAEANIAAYEISVSVTWQPKGSLRINGMRIVYENK